MKTKVKMMFLAFVLAASFVGVGITSTSTEAANILGKILKVGGISYVVDRFGPQINDFVNKITANNNLSTKDATAVVPIITLGSGGYVGAVQVVGESKRVAETKAVVQLEENTVLGSAIRVKALIPINVKSVTNMKRIYGVGVSAIIDISF